jgi:hypothetical protein
LADNLTLMGGITHPLLKLHLLPRQILLRLIPHHATNQVGPNCQQNSIINPEHNLAPKIWKRPHHRHQSDDEREKHHQQAKPSHDQK